MPMGQPVDKHRFPTTADPFYDFIWSSINSDAASI